MSDNIFLVNKDTKELSKVEPLAFSDIGIKERQDLQEWVLENPDLLGEPLLVVTSEYDKFDKSSKRLDVLALDKTGSLVIVELKLETQGSLADLQAIRYAAFCSTMTWEDVIDEFTSFNECDSEKANERILNFLDESELPILDNKPRIILAAGSVDDPELTSSVLWLRSFGVDISCVELTPYLLQKNEQIILVPRVIIPIPEAKDYMINVERKEAAQVKERKDAVLYRNFWKLVAEELNALDTRFKSSGKSSDSYLTLLGCKSTLHYEWYIRKKERIIEASLHFEEKEREKNIVLLNKIKEKEAEIAEGIDFDFKAAPWGKRWASAGFLIPVEGMVLNKEIAAIAAKTMKVLIDRTYSIVEQYFKK